MNKILTTSIAIVLLLLLTACASEDNAAARRLDAERQLENERQETLSLRHEQFLERQAARHDNWITYTLIITSICVMAGLAWLAYDLTLSRKHDRAMELQHGPERISGTYYHTLQGPPPDRHISIIMLGIPENQRHNAYTQLSNVAQELGLLDEPDNLG